MRSVEDSLRRLGLDRIDVLHVHDPDEDFPVAVTDAYRALAELRARGTVGAVSIGVNHVPVAARYLREAAAPGPDCVLLASRYNLLDHTGLDDLLPLCAARGVAVLAAGVYQSGLFTDPRPTAPHDYALTGGGAPTTVPAALARRVGRWHALCRRFGVPPAAAAVRFPFGHPAVTGVVVGARTPAEVADTASAFTHPVPADFWTTARSTGLLPPHVPTPRG
jgi:D-threo-aldose 1-dehydrogenase